MQSKQDSFYVDSLDWSNIQNGLLPCFVGIGVHFSKVKLDVHGLEKLNRPNQRVLSGFVIAYRDLWMFITAGHVIRELSSSSEKGYKNVSMSFVDGFSPASGKITHIPFSFNEKQWMVVDDDDSGTDIGIYFISEYYRALFQAGGVKPAVPSLGEFDQNAYDCFSVMGAPLELERESISDLATRRLSQVSVAVPMLRLWTSGIPEHVKSEMARTNRFLGRIESLKGIIDGQQYEIKDIDGMSGGPVFGIKFDGKSARVSIVGVQSCWKKQHRVCGVTKISSFVDWLDNKIDTLLDSAND